MKLIPINVYILDNKLSNSKSVAHQADYRHLQSAASAFCTRKQSKSLEIIVLAFASEKGGSIPSPPIGHGRILTVPSFFEVCFDVLSLINLG
jgi:hypothetical protein